jgi:hypothetical protein
MLEKQRTKSWLLSLASIAMMLLSGCGDGKVVVRGMVTVDGQPIDEGSISLEPSDGQGPTTGGLIKAGKYELAGSAAVEPGKKIVRIVGLRQTGKMVPAGPPAPKGTLIPQMIQCVPSHYNDQSRLQVDVTPGKANKHDFQLDSKAIPPKATSLLRRRMLRQIATDVRCATESIPLLMTSDRSG